MVSIIIAFKINFKHMYIMVAITNTWQSTTRTEDFTHSIAIVQIQNMLSSLKIYCTLLEP